MQINIKTFAAFVALYTVATLYSPLAVTSFLFALVLFFWQLFSYRKLRVWTTAELLLIALFASAAVSWLFSPHRGSSLIPTIYFGATLVSALAIGHKVDRSALKKILTWCLVGFAIVSFRNFFVIDLIGTRAIGIPGQPNALGVLSATGIMIAIWRFNLADCSRTDKTLCAIVAVTSLYWLLMSGSRGALFSAVLGVAVLAPMKRSLIIGLLGGLALYGLLISGNISKIFEDIGLAEDGLLARYISFFVSFAEGGGISESDASRLYIVQDVIAGFFENPVFGKGLSSYGVTHEFSYTHNAFLEILYSQGLVGVTLYLFLMGIAFFRSIRTNNRLLRSAVVFYVFCGATLPNVYGKTQLVVLALIVAMTAMTRPGILSSMDSRAVKGNPI